MAQHSVLTTELLLRWQQTHRPVFSVRPSGTSHYLSEGKCASLPKGLPRKHVVELCAELADPLLPSFGPCRQSVLS